MSDTIRSLDALLALFADNTTGQISAQDLRDFIVSAMATDVKFTSDGGVAIKLTNKTGADSVKGTAVAVSGGTDNAFALPGVDAYDITAFVYESGVADGSECWVVVAGIAVALVEDSTAVSRKDLMLAGGTTSGRIEPASAVPPPTNAEHFREVGHAITGCASGTDNTVKIIIHWN